MLHVALLEAQLNSTPQLVDFLLRAALHSRLAVQTTNTVQTVGALACPSPETQVLILPTNRWIDAVTINKWKITH